MPSSARATIVTAVSQAGVTAVPCLAHEAARKGSTAAGCMRWVLGGTGPSARAELTDLECTDYVCDSLHRCPDAGEHEQGVGTR